MRLDWLSAALFLTWTVPTLNAPTVFAQDTLQAPRSGAICIVVLTPGRVAPLLSLTDIQGRLADGVAANTRFVSRFVDEGAVATCRGSLGCMVDRVRTHVSKTRLLLVVTVVAQPTGPNEIDATLVDPRAADRVAHDHPNDEDRIEREATLVRTNRQSASTPEELGRIVDGWFGGLFERAIDAHPILSANGRIEIIDAPMDAVVLLDGVEVGRVASSSTNITDVVAGHHHVRLVPSNAPEFEVELAVDPGNTAVVRTPASHGSSTSSNGVLRYSGLGVFAVGVAATIWGLASASSFDTNQCVRSAALEESCSGGGFVTLGEAVSRRDRLPADRGGLLLAPLGYGLAIAGGYVALSASDLLPWSKEWPWWTSVLIGVALGGTAYGLSAALDGG